MTSKTLVFAEQFYYPEGWGGAQLPRDITTHLAREGLPVEVICGSDMYAPIDDPSIRNPSLDGVTIRRVPRLFRGDIHKFKLLRQVWFYAAAAPLLLFGSRALFISQTNPPLIVPLAALSALLRRRPLIIIAQDLYPEVVFAHGSLPQQGVLAQLLSAIFNWAYRRATRVVSLGPTMSSRLLQKGVRANAIVEISNWATGEQSIVVRGPANLLRVQWGLGGKFVLMYSGNLGIAHDIVTPLRAVERALQSIPNLVLLFIGKGSRLAEAKALAQTLGIAHAVQFREFVPFELLPHSLGLADVALVTLKNGFEGLVVPSKALGYLARGIPTLYIGPVSDISSLLAESGGGLVFTGGDSGSVADALCALFAEPQRLADMSFAAEHHYEAKLTMAVGLQKYSALVAEVLHAARSSS